MLKKFRLTPAVLLFFLAPAIGELLSGSAPPAEFFSFFGLVALGILYGGGALLAREMTRRWGQGWPSLLLLGAAYGIIEEGLMVKSFFDPTWMDLGVLGVYGRWGGVNWVWSLELTIYHAVFSIAIPVLLTTLAFPGQRQQAWLSPRGFRWMAALFVLNGIFITLFLTPYRPPVIPYLAAVSAVLWLVRRAQRLPHREGLQGNSPLHRARWFYFAGFGATLAFFFTNWVLPNTSLPPLATMLLTVVVAYLAYKRIRRAISVLLLPRESHLLSLAAGALSFFIILAPLQEMDTTRPDNTQGMTLVGLSMLTFLIWLSRRIKHSTAPAAADQDPNRPAVLPQA